MWAKRLTAHIIMALLFVTACHKRPPVVAAPPRVVALPEPLVVTFPPPRIVPLPEPVMVPPPAAPTPTVAALEQANRSFSAGVYEEAAQAYENYLRLLPPGCPCDQELFRLGLSYVLRSPKPDWQRATAVLTQLVSEYPNSSFTAPANVILALRSELNHLATHTAVSTKERDERIRQLSSELDRLKKIDADRRRRP